MRILLSLFVLALPFVRVLGEPNGTSFSSIQFVNAASTERIRLQVGDQVWHSTFRPGQKTSAGAFPHLDWPLCLIATDEGTQIESQFSALAGRSYTAVIVGDFKKDSGKISDGQATNRANSTTEEVRAKILILPNEIDPRRGHRLRVVNGLVGTPINFSFLGRDRVPVAFGEMRALTELPAAMDLRVEAGGMAFNLSFQFVPPERGCTIAFYLVGDQISYVAANEVVLTPDGNLPSASQEAIDGILNQFDGSIP